MAGTLPEVVLFLSDKPQGGEFLVFDDTTGRQIDVDIRGVRASQEPLPESRGPGRPRLGVVARQIDVDIRTVGAAKTQLPEPKGPGRPRLGVVAREVTLLPRHWDWLAQQPGGASVALRKLVDQARSRSGASDRVRAAQEAAYSFMSAVAGNLPGFEEAARALFAYDRRRFGDLIAGWPEDVRDFAVKLAFADQEPTAG